jgi:hypothetical protein
MADALTGSAFLNIGGRSALRLARPVAASLANLSANSLPATLLCPEIQLSLILADEEFAALVRAWTMCWPEAAFGLVVAVMKD